ncbi:MAG TPA: 30S ribosome-binding factor RbfA [Longimicrobiaceae bacterium]|jgi:ribosome-binding factor A|nr:30S ribosome-binding factor RbfA [Longimicrobiaceae bacterium]
MPRYRRTDRINEQLRQEISLLLRDEVRDPRAALATVTAVETSPELDHAKVYVTALGDEKEKAETVAGLQSAAAFMRGQLGRRLHMRRVPELHFRLDRALEEAIRIETLLREALPEGVEAESDADAAPDTTGGEGAE